ncbi:MAG TPA: alkylhydroperoxidase [Gammaproteobacteria bacterium]|nr:alkylhydroperoxidase [Gammaproteobacteria bacterium]|tara:strand:- start:105 stop:758 length:654 start_codon:yes stop_codon:yes gene_type:complete
MKQLDSLSRSEYISKVELYKKWAPAAFETFNKFAGATFSDGALSNKEKEIIAVGCAHSLRCPYCIDYHIKLALEAGALKEEIAESIWVAIALGSGACLAHAAIAIKTLDGATGDFYNSETSAEIKKFSALMPEMSARYVEFEDAAFRDGVLPSEFKYLIAIACAHNTRCPFCIEHHVGQALKTNQPNEVIAEAIWVAIEMGAGACFGHAGLSAAILE